MKNLIKICIVICLGTMAIGVSVVDGKANGDEHQEEVELPPIELFNRDVEFVYQEVEEPVNEEIIEEIDYRFEALVQATWRLETGNGTSYLWASCGNAGGIKQGSEYKCYPNQEQGMSELRGLLTWYVEQFGYDFRAIRDLYCQCGEQDYINFMQIYNEELQKLGGY